MLEFANIFTRKFDVKDYEAKKKSAIVNNSPAENVFDSDSMQKKTTNECHKF